MWLRCGKQGFLILDSRIRHTYPSHPRQHWIATGFFSQRQPTAPKLMEGQEQTRWIRKGREEESGWAKHSKFPGPNSPIIIKSFFPLWGMSEGGEGKSPEMSLQHMSLDMKGNVRSGEQMLPLTACTILGAWDTLWLPTPLPYFEYLTPLPISSCSSNVNSSVKLEGVGGNIPTFSEMHCEVISLSCEPHRVDLHKAMG